MTLAQRLLVLFAAGCVALLLIGNTAEAFAQISSRQFRERAGSVLRVPVATTDHARVDGLRREEKVLMSQFADAAQGRNWKRIESLWRGYSGSEYPVYCAAMQGAISCEKYKEAAKMHDKLWGMSTRPNASVPYAVGIRIFGQLGKAQRVAELWKEALSRSLVNLYVAHARIDAAAALGDVEGAAGGLDYMIEFGYKVEVSQFNSAINACKNSPNASHNAANYLFKEMKRRQLQPDAATFGALFGAYVDADLDTVLQAWTAMDDCSVQPNRIIAESYMTALLGRFPANCTSPASLVPELEKRRPARRQAAKRALADMKRRRVILTKLCENLAKALKRLST